MNQNLEKINKQGRLFDPFRDFFDFENFFPGFPNWTRQSRNMIPAVNVAEDDKSYYLDVMAPGFKKGDFTVKVDDDMLTISAETKSESGDGKDNGTNNNRQYTRREYSYSSFTRAFRLPENAKDDSITASYEDGVLKLSIPKTEQQVKASKEIQIK